MVLSKALHVIKNYPNFVVKQPLVAAEIESALRWISYFAAGKMLCSCMFNTTNRTYSPTASKYNSSHILSEFLYSSANLMQLLNDNLLRKAAKIGINIDATVTHLQTLLQVLEYTSVLMEYSTNRFASDVGRWIIIGCFQVAKAVIRLILLLKYKQGLTTGNPILPLDRRADLISLQNNNPTAANIHEGRQEDEDHVDEGIEGDSSDPTVKLKRSGRVMRTLDKAPSRGQRNWLLPNVDPRFRQLLEKNRKDAPPTALTDHHVIAEILHITRPVVHLAFMGIFGTAAWTPYVVSLGMDLGSLKLLHEPHDKIWNLKERIELGQRSFALILYLLRSPFFDRYTKERILRILSGMANKIPLFGRLIQPMVTYLPEWQRTYFYVWGA